MSVHMKMVKFMTEMTPRQFVIASLFVVALFVSVGLGLATRQHSSAMVARETETVGTAASGTESAGSAAAGSETSGSAPGSTSTRGGASATTQASSGRAFTNVVNTLPPVPKPAATVATTVIVPRAVCQSLVSTQPDKANQPNTYHFTAKAQIDAGAAVSRVVYEFTDGTAAVTKSSLTDIVEHTFAKDADVTVTVYAKVLLGGFEIKATGACKQHITFAAPAAPPAEEDKCTVVGKENLPKNDPDCKEVLGATTAPAPTAPASATSSASTAMPNTGPGSVLALFAGTSAAGFIGHQLYLKRRSPRA